MMKVAQADLGLSYDTAQKKQSQYLEINPEFITVKLSRKCGLVKT